MRPLARRWEYWNIRVSEAVFCAQATAGCGILGAYLLHRYAVSDLSLFSALYLLTGIGFFMGAWHFALRLKREILDPADPPLFSNRPDRDALRDADAHWDL